ncbi:MAG: SMP-30/gluconolactonase/LRE family protein [Arthrospira platensis]
MGMRRRWRGLLGCVLACVVGSFGSWSAAASAEEAASTSGSLTENPLVIAGAELLLEGQLAATEEAAVSSPEAVAAREESASKYESLTGSEAAVLAREAFPGLVAQVSGGLPRLPAGVSVAGYPSDYAAALDLGGGKRAVLESLAPVAVGLQGARVPVDMTLAETGSGFAPRTTAAGVQIPKALSEGASLSDSGVSLTPVDEQGRPLSGEASGTVDGASVFYGNVASDTDVAVKPLGVGFDMQAVLRSVRSPEKLWFRIGLPPGVLLSQISPGGSIRVMADGLVIARILPATARDAAGTRVPVSTTLSGDRLEVSVSHPSGAYRFPIDVDPVVGDTKLLGQGTASNWKAATWNGSYEVFKFSEINKRELVDSVSGAHNKYEWGQFGYTTQGSSRIYEFGSSTYGWSENISGQNINILGIVKLIKPGEDEYEESYDLPSNYNIVYHDLCAKATCSYISGAAGNAATFQQYVETSGSERFEGLIVESYISIYQEAGPTASFDTADASVGGTPNASTGQWVSPPATHAVLGLTATDPGIGIYKATVTSPQELPFLNPYKTAANPLSGCSGVQCYMCWNWPSSCAGGVRPDGLPESSGSPLTFALEPSEAGEFYTWLPDGEDSVTATVENATGATSTVTRTIKIDSTPPTGVVLSGLPAGNEIGEGVYRVKAEATDGSGTTPSSGVASLALIIDGREVGAPNGSCSVGPCKASGEWTLNGAEYGAGKHGLVVVATDGAGNRTPQQFTLTVHHATPVAVGPGSVDPQSGDFTLQATDVSVGGLSVTRGYSSRSVVNPEPGPFGPQWGVSLASIERLTEQPDGSTVVTGASGGTTSFATNGSGGFESPKGDGNLKLESVAKGYVLKDEATKTSTEFTQPEGSSFATPRFASSLGWTGAANGALKQPGAVAVDSKGNVWVVDKANYRIEEFNEKGEYVKQFGTKGSGQGEFNEPYDIAFDPKGNFWVSDIYNNRIEKFNSLGQYIGQVGGKEGTGPSEFKDPEGIATDSKGNLYVADIYNDRIQEFKENTEYVTQFGKSGSGENKEFNVPLGVAIDSKNNIWIADTYNHRIQEYSEAGTLIRIFGKLGTGHAEFETPVGIAVDSGGHVWVADYAEDRVQELGEKGEYLTEFGTKGWGAGQFEHPYFLTVASRGTVWVADAGNNRVERWSHPTWVPTVAEGVVATDKMTYAYTTSLVAGKPVTQPTEALAPVAAGISCSPELKPGCRALTFNYASTTTATTEKWGDYEGQLTRVYYTAYDPVSKAMKTVEVAHYLYDSQARLRAEWDPRIEPEVGKCAKEPLVAGCLTTVYGYDAEGHVTALTPPGQESWAMTYGTVAGDANAGRLVKVTRAPASAALWSGAAPVNTEVPKMSGTPVVGVKLGVSTGVWSNQPVAYQYQWEDCNYKAMECTLILGASNPNYTVAGSDEGHAVVAVVSAINGAGSVSATTIPGRTVGSPAAEYSLPASSYPLNVAEGPDQNIWFTDYFTGKIGKITHSGSITEYALPSGSGPEGIVAGPDGNIWYDDYNETAKRAWVGKMTSSGSATEYSAERGPVGLAVGPEGNIWGAALRFECAILKIATSGSMTPYKTPNIATDPEYIAKGSDGNMWYTGRGDNTIGKLVPASGAITAYSLPASSHPYGIASGADGNLWFAEAGTSKIGKITTAGVITEYALPAKSEPFGVTLGPDGNIWFTNVGTSKVGKITTSGVITEYALPAGSEPGGIVSGPEGDLWYTDVGTSKIGKMPTSGNGTATNGTSYSPGQGSTVEYGVPLSGTGKAYEMSAAEVKKWAQEDVPYEATAIFPPDEPQGWPASDYRRATVYYVDNKGHTVNIATPGGGIATSEYNETNDVTRTLSADNRAIAVKEAKPEEVAKQLDTQSAYNSEGTELLSTLGPKHTVKLAHGRTKENEEVQARAHTVYSYDVGAPAEGGPYRLVTKVVQTAKIEGEEKEYDPRTTTTSYSGQNNLGWKLRAPTSVTTDPEGLKLTHTTVYDEATGNVLETSTPGAQAMPVSYAAKFGTLGTGNGQFKEPHGLALSLAGNVYVLDTGDSRVEEFSQAGKYEAQFGSSGEGAGQLSKPYGMAVDSKGDVWVADWGNNRVVEFNEKHEFVRTFGYGVSDGKSEYEICTASCRTGIAGSGAGQFKEPKGVAVSATGTVYVSDAANSRIEEFKEKGEFIATFGYGVSDGKSVLEVCTTTCRAGVSGSGNGQFNQPRGVARGSGGNVYVVESGNNRVQEFNEKNEYVLQFGTAGTGTGQFKGPKGIALTASGNVVVADEGNSRVEMFSSTGSFVATFGTKGTGAGQFEEPLGIAVTSNESIYVADAKNDRVEQWTPGNPHETRTVYYTTAGNSEYSNCGGHPEWANLPCETLPRKQPESNNVPNLPVTTVAYNMYDEPTTATSTVGTSTRTTTIGYDGVGRPETSETTSNVGTSLPKVTDKYSTTMGLPIEQATSTETLKSAYNKLGQLTEYTDADGNTTKYEYEGEGVYKGEHERDGRLKHVDDGKGTQTYTYDETMGLPKELTDSAAGTFSAAYDAEGRLISEGYPNAMSVNLTTDQAGQTTSLQYVKNKTCTGTCPETWYSDSTIPSIHGQWITQTSSFATNAYSYDNAGRLTQGQDTPIGGGCVTRVYTYDEETNRLSATTRQPGTGGVCATEGGTVESHSYDSANRLADSGAVYDPFGNTTSLPAADAGGFELASTYFTDNQLATQTQNNQTLGYQLDPAGRTREIVSTGKVTATEIQHYSGPGSGLPSWTGELSTNSTRYITGISGELAAIQHNGETPVLQVANLHGDIIATAADSETVAKLASTVSEASEYGVPATEAPPKFSWLGSHQVPTTLPSGVTTMGVRSYIPQLGRFLQTDPRAGGSANQYAYTYGDPVNSNDLSGEFTYGGTDVEMGGGNLAVQKQMAEEQAAREEAERKAAEAAALAGMYAGFESEGPEEWGEEYEEEGWYEEAAYHPGAKGQQEARAEPALLVQPLTDEEASPGENTATTLGSLIPLCKAGSIGPCTRDVQGCYGPNHGCGRPGQHRVPYHNPEPSAGAGRRRGGSRGGGNSPGQRAAMRCVMGAGLGADGGPVGAAAGCVIGALWEY